MDIKTLSEKIEKVSQIYVKEFGIKRDGDWYLLKLQEELGELIQSYLMLIKQARSKGKSPKELKESFDEEVVDVLCHVLLLARFHNVNLEKVIEEKWLRWSK